LFFYFQYDLVGETDRKGHNDPKHRAEEIIKKLDVSGDKKLSKQEFIAGYILYNYISLFTYYIFFSIRCKTDPVIRKMLAPNV
jgi:hypothetical protein